MAWGTVDDFGVPDNLLGQHSEDFYAVVGRIVCLCALLENRLLALYEALADAPTDEYKGLQLDALIKGALKTLAKAPATEPRHRLIGYLQRAEPIPARRNDYVHNLWPAQADGRLCGWRPDRSKEATPGSAVTTEVELADARDLVTLLVDLLVEWPNMFGRVRIHHAGMHPADPSNETETPRTRSAVDCTTSTGVFPGTLEAHEATYGMVPT